MFNISEKTKIEGLEEIGISKGHLAACIHDKNCCESTRYSYFGKFSSRGTKIVRTKVGKVLVSFEEKNGWARIVSVQLIEKKEV